MMSRSVFMVLLSVFSLFVYSLLGFGVFVNLCCFRCGVC